MNRVDLESRFAVAVSMSWIKETTIKQVAFPLYGIVLIMLIAVEMLPDIMRTLGNVTMDVAVTATVDRRSAEEREA